MLFGGCLYSKHLDGSPTQVDDLTPVCLAHSVGVRDYAAADPGGHCNRLLQQMDEGTQSGISFSQSLRFYLKLICDKII